VLKDGGYTHEISCGSVLKASVKDKAV